MMLAVDLAIKITRTMNQQEWTLMSSKVLYDWLYDDFFCGVHVHVLWSVKEKNVIFSIYTRVTNGNEEKSV